MEQVMSESHETDAIRHRMEKVRCDLDHDVQGITESARDMRDWRSYVKSHPWVCLGAAVAVGYLVVPRRVAAIQRDAQPPADFAKQSQLPATASSQPKVGVRGALLAIVGNVILRRALSYVEQHAGRYFAQQAAGSQPATESQPAAGPPQDDRHEEPHS